MANKSTFIKLDRNILRWAWYGNGNVFRVFVHLLLTAAVEPQLVGNHLIGRGDVLTSLERLQQQLNMSLQCIRTALLTLKNSGAVTQYKIGRNAVYHVVNYDYYQSKVTQKKKPELTQLSTENQHETNKELTTHKKEELRNNNIYSHTARAREENTVVFPGGESDEPEKLTYGAYGNVRLTDDEYRTLSEQFGKDTLDGAIDILDGHIQKRGAAFRSECHAAEIREWAAVKFLRLQAERKSATYKSSRASKAASAEAGRLDFDLDGLCKV